MSSLVRSLGPLFKVGVAGALAYRAELLVWTLATTMPLVMLALFSAAAEDVAFGRYGSRELVAYFLAVFVVRQLTGSWVAWTMSQEVRDGSLARRLLRPVSALLSYAVESASVMPLRAVVALPVAVTLLATVGAASLTHEGRLGAAFVLAVAGGWAITLLINLIIGTLALYIESSAKVMDLYLVVFFVFSGYLFPVELLPPGLRAVTERLPFRFQIGLPVELLIGVYDGRAGDAVVMLAWQWGWVALLVGVCHLCWRVGLRRFSAYGG